MRPRPSAKRAISTPQSKWENPTERSIGLVVWSHISTTGMPLVESICTVPSEWLRPARITPAGRRTLAEHGIAPPGPAPHPAPGPVPLTLAATRPAVPCPRCGSADTEETSRFGATSCKALWRCGACREPFEHLKEI